VRKKWLRPLIAVATIVALTAAGALYWLNRETKPPRLILFDTQQLVTGKHIYEEQCARCHGVYMEGQPNWQTPLPNGRLPAPPHDDSGHTWHHPDSYLFSVTKYGMVPPYAPAGYQSDMPAFKEVLSDEAILDALLYIKARWTENALEYQRRVTIATDGPYVSP
jgi:S-disulfanyl-L-cysteine oxidoreductase SoxD